MGGRRAENLISVRVVRSKVERPCDAADCAGDPHSIPVGKPHLRFYGSAYRSDPPYVLRVDPDCAHRGWDDRVDAALDALRDSGAGEET